MKILNARVNEMVGYANPPHLELLVDTLDHEFTYRAKQTDHGTAYFAETEGHVRFFHHSPNNERGYGGYVFHITLTDGTTRNVRGPWSSNGEQMEKYFGIQTESVSITDDPAVFERGYTFRAGHITTELFQTAAPFVPDWNLGHGYHGITRKER